MRSLSVIWTLFVKDLRLEWRQRETLAAVCVFGVLVVFLFNFAFQPGGEESLRLLPGLLWIAFAFAGILGFNRSFAAERENGCLEGLRLAPIDPGLIYLAKALSNFVFLAIAEVVIVFAVSIWYNFSFFPSLKWFACVVFFGTLGYVAVGVTFGGVAANTRMREVMLPVLQFPVIIPIFIGAIEATSSVLKGDSPAQFLSWVKLLITFSIIFLVLSFLLFEYVLEE
ncbi:MAG: heme exporter protein CcmB [Terriglobia bacterium]